MRPARAGYTLFEILIAAAIMATVMGLAIHWFSGMTRMTGLAKSRVTAQQEAARGVAQLVDLIRRAHVIYYTGRPLQAFPVSTAAELAAADGLTNDPPTAPVPPILGAGPTGYAPQPAVFYNFADPTAALNAPGTVAINRARFRFHDAGGSAADFLTLADERLRSAAPDATGPDNQFFSSPLMYLAEAHFQSAPVGGQVVAANLPLSWTFHVIYLAPMRVAANDAGLARPGKDDGSAGGGPWRRSTIPLELRWLTVPDVEADRSGDPAHGRATDPAATVSPFPILPAPFDYVAGTTMANYDPIRVPTALDSTKLLTTATPYRWLSGATLMDRPPSGERIRNGGIHANYNQLGNDPPTQQALANRLGTRPATDRAVVSYVDPDSVQGTCIRLLNTIRPRAHDTAPGHRYRRYLDAYGGPFLYNHYARSLPPGTGVDQRGAWKIETGAGALPSRALVSVTVRYRNDSRVPFQFSTASQEVELENLKHFQSINRTAD